MATNYHLVQSLVKSLAVLEALAEAPDGMGVTEIGERIGLNKSTVHRILTTLVHWNYVEQDRAKGDYRISFKLFEIARKILNNIRPTKIITPFLDKLAEATGESARFIMVDPDNARLIVCDEVLTSKPIKVSSNLGESLSLSKSAAGKMFLAGFTDNEIKELMDEKGRKAVLEDEEYSFSELRKHLGEVRETGYAYESHKQDEEMICNVAAPVRNESGKIIAMLDVFAPAYRCPKNVAAKYGKLVSDTALEVSKKLGHIPPS